MFNVIHTATNSRYADGNDIRLVKLAPIALLNSYKLTTNSGKHLKGIIQAHMVF